MQKLKNFFTKTGLILAVGFGILGNLGLVFSLTVDKNILDVVAYIQKMILTSNGMPDGNIGVKLNDPQGEIWVRNAIKTPGLLEANNIEATIVSGSLIRVNDGGRLEIPPGALSDGSVLESDLATGAVSTRVLADGSVTKQKLASGINLGYWEQVSGGIAYNSGDVFVGNVKISSSGISQNLNSDMVDGFHAADILAMNSASSAGGDFITLYRRPQGNPETSDPGLVNCPIGYTLVYRGGYTYLRGVYDYYYNGNTATFISSPNGGCIKGLSPSFIYDNVRREYNIVLGCKICKKINSISEITVFWKTKGTYNGNLGGRTGADAKCQAEIPAYLQGKLTNVHAVVNVTESDEIIDYLDADPDDDGVARGEFPVEAPIYYFDSSWSKFTVIYGDWMQAIADVGSSILRSNSIIGIAGVNRRGEGFVSEGNGVGLRNCNWWTAEVNTVGGYIVYDGYRNNSCPISKPLLCMGVMSSSFIKW